jgi:hypothetical protein
MKFLEFLITILFLLKLSKEIDIFYHPSFLQALERNRIDTLPTGENVYPTRCYVVTDEDKPDEKLKEYKSNIAFATDNIHVIENKKNVKNITYSE